MNALVFCPAHNTNKPDATGEFIPSATTFCSLHGALTPIRFDNSLDFEDRKRFALSRIVKQPPWSTTFASRTRS